MSSDNASETLEGRRILIVEDMLVIATEIESMLLDLGCEVVGPIPKLAKAVECVQREKLDGAVLDVNLDGEDVFPVADELLLRRVPFMFVTGYDDRVLPAEFRQWPRLDKPFTAERFEAKLREIFHSADADRAKAHQTG